MAQSRTTLAAVRDRAAAYAALVRVPNLFTAPPDVLLGATLVTGSVRAAPRPVAGLALASVLLYAAGTTLNDAFDASVDARERPCRPIPSGEVSRGTGFALGGALLLAAVTVAWLTAGAASAGVSAAIAAGILLYDGVLKDSAAGFLTMGAIRGLNVVLGTTVAGSLPRTSPDVVFAVPLVVTGYIAAVTAMAAGETAGGNRAAVAVAAIGTALATATVVGFAWVIRSGLWAVATALSLGAAFLLWTGRPLRRAYADPTPERVGPAVGACVVGLVLLDAGFAAAVDPASGVVVALFLLPAVGLARTFDVT